MRGASLTAFSLLFYGGMLLVALLIAGLRGNLPLWWSIREPWIDVSLGIGGGLAVVVLSRLALRISALKKLAEEFHPMLEGLSRRDVLLLALASSIGEETLFRGALQPELGLLATSTLFACVHIGPRPRFLWWTGFAWIMGIVMGMLFEWRGNLIAPVLLHFVVNLLNLYHLSRLEVEPT